MSRGLVLMLFACAIGALTPCVGAPIAPAADDDAVIIDQGEFFSADAIERAAKVNHQIGQQFGKEVIIETFPEIPADKLDAFRTKEKNQFYETWLQELARRRKVNGLFILIVRNPGRLQVGVGEKAAEKRFTAGDRDRLRDLMLEHIRGQRYDQALVQGLQFVLQRMSENPLQKT